MTHSDLSQQLGTLTQRFEAATTPGGRGRVIVFMSAREDGPRAMVAREFARQVARTAKRGVWLIDLDLHANTHCRAFSEPETERLCGALGGAFDATQGETPFWSVRDAQDAPVEGENRFVTLRQVGAQRLFVSHFNGRAMREGWRVRMRDAPDYWRAVRQAADLIVVDAPARARSAVGLTVAPRANGVVVVTADHGPALAEARRVIAEIEGRGARCEGAVLLGGVGSARGEAA